MLDEMRFIRDIKNLGVVSSTAGPAVTERVSCYSVKLSFGCDLKGKPKSATDCIRITNHIEHILAKGDGF